MWEMWIDSEFAVRYIIIIIISNAPLDVVVTHQTKLYYTTHYVKKEKKKRTVCIHTFIHSPLELHFCLADAAAQQL